MFGEEHNPWSSSSCNFAPFLGPTTLLNTPLLNPNFCYCCHVTDRVWIRQWATQNLQRAGRRPMPEALPSKAYVCSRSLAGAGDRILLRAWMFVCCICWVLCKQRPLRRADHSFKEVLVGVPENLTNEVAQPQDGLYRRRKNRTGKRKSGRHFLQLMRCSVIQTLDSHMLLLLKVLRR
jgi:hypothetical protein